MNLCLYCERTTHQTCLCGAHQCALCERGLCPICVRMMRYNTRLVVPRAMRTQPLRIITRKLSAVQTQKASTTLARGTVTMPTIKLRRVQSADTKASLSSRNLQDATI